MMGVVDIAIPLYCHSFLIAYIFIFKKMSLSKKFSLTYSILSLFCSKLLFNNYIN